MNLFSESFNLTCANWPLWIFGLGIAGLLAIGLQRSQTYNTKKAIRRSSKTWVKQSYKSSIVLGIIHTGIIVFFLIGLIFTITLFGFICIFRIFV